jgi:hypothetical protein
MLSVAAPSPLMQYQPFSLLRNGNIIFWLKGKLKSQSLLGFIIKNVGFLEQLIRGLKAYSHWHKQQLGCWR